MKRVKKERKEINKDLGNVKGLFKSIIVMLLKAIYTLIKNLIYIGYVLIYNFNNFMAKLFIKLPRILRVFAIYSLIAINIVYFIGLNKKPLKMAKNDKIERVEKNDKVAYVEIEKNEETEIDEEEELKELEEVEQEKDTSCTLSEIECKIYNRGIEKGMTRQQSLLAVAISKHETGVWQSYIYKNNKNFGGLFSKSQNHFIRYTSFDEGLDAYLNCLQKWYYGKGLTTPKTIQPHWAPVGANNDPNNQNSHWLSAVTRYYNQYLSK